jgi:DNA adenine methylase
VGNLSERSNVIDSNKMKKPFLKWAGNKFRVLPHLLPIIGDPKRYIEPFGGSMAVALNVSADEYILNDINNDLVNLYGHVTDVNDDTFIKYCQELFYEGNNREAYNEMRDLFNQSTDSLERSRMFVYLNRHCFNGLTRYNSKGGFNVPFGKMKNPKCPVNEMMQFRMYFLQKKHRFMSTSFEDSALYENIESGDVVYFDPPYVPASDTANFANYAKEGFSYDQQVQLAELAESLANRGAKVIISNHDTDVSRQLYKNAEIHSIQVARSIAANKTSRKKANELIAVYQ